MKVLEQSNLIAANSKLSFVNSGALEIMMHPFFAPINWYDLYHRDFGKLPAGLIPRTLKYDVSFFNDRYKKSRLSEGEIQRLWRLNDNDLPSAEKKVEDDDDLRVENWSYIDEDLKEQEQKEEDKEDNSGAELKLSPKGKLTL